MMSKESSLDAPSLETSVVEDRGCWEKPFASVHVQKVWVEHAEVNQERLVL